MRAMRKLYSTQDTVADRLSTLFGLCAFPVGKDKVSAAFLFGVLVGLAAWGLIP